MPQLQCNRELAGLKMLWACLAKEFPEEDKTFWEEHKVNLERINKLQSATTPNEEIAVTVPHLIPFLSGCKDLKDRRSFRLMFAEVFGGGADGGVECDTVPADLDNHPQFQAHIAQVQLYLGQGVVSMEFLKLRYTPKNSIYACAQTENDQGSSTRKDFVRYDK